MLVIGGSSIQQHGGSDLALKTVIMSDENLQVGFDQFDQFMLIQIEGGRRVMSPIRDVRGKSCAFCGRTWDNTDVKLFVNQVSLDDGLFAHQTCFIGHLSYNDHKLFRSALSDSHLYSQHINRIPNEYGGAWDSSWFTGELMHWPLSVRFGRRKRVWEVVFTSDKKIAWKSDIRERFEKEGVTTIFKDESVLFHAWTESKLHEYFKHVASCLKAITNPLAGDRIDMLDGTTRTVKKIGYEWGPGWWVETDKSKSEYDTNFILHDQGKTWKEVNRDTIGRNRG